MQANIFKNSDVCLDGTAVITEKSRHISYKELWGQADQLARRIEKRCLTVIVCKNNLESIVGYIGLTRAGIVPLMVNFGIKIESLRDILIKFKPEYIFLPTENINDVKEARAVSVFGDYSLLQTDYQIDYSIHDDLALLLATSGSTGSPDMVRLSYGNIWSNTNSIVESLGISYTDRTITTMPMSYSYGLSIVNTHLFKGASIILTDATLMEKRFWSLIKDCNATTFGGVPFIYEMLKKLRFEKMELPCLKYITQAGGKLNQKMIEEFARICSTKSIAFYVMYGQTEATARMSCLPWKYIGGKTGSIGYPIPGGSFYLEDQNGNILEDDDILGEIVYQGDNVSLGYAKNCDFLCKGDENRGVLHTGDLGKRDRDGFYYIVGRKSRFLKIFGNRVSLDQVEQLIKSAGYECACGGVDDRLKIFVTDVDTVKDVKNIMTTKTTINRSGYIVELIDEIPRGHSGKVLYSSLNNMKN
jgi:long-chain acyl-CoA synthetase